MMRRKLIENDIETTLHDLCKENKILCYKFVSPGNSGVPDRLLIGNGKIIFVELKKPGETPRKLQEITHKHMRAQGADVRVIDSLDGVHDIVKEILANKKRRSKPKQGGVL